MGALLSFPAPVATVPTEDEFTMITDAVTIAAELLGDEAALFHAKLHDLPADRLGDIASSLASASTWLQAWSEIVNIARERLAASAA